MNVRFDHLSLRAKNPERMKTFLCELLGLTVGFRPNLSFDGYFLYAGDNDLVHIFPRQDSHGVPPSESNTLAEENIVHHVSFHSDDYDELMTRIAVLELNYSVSQVPDTGVKQIFVRAPENLLVEIQVVQ